MSKHKPRSLRWHSQALSNVLRRLLRILVKLKVSRVRVQGRENLMKPKNGFIVASNHISIMDPVYLWGAMPRNATAIAMKELWSWPIIGHLVRLMGHIPVDRRDRDSGRQALQHAIQVLRAGGPVIIYPEGGISATEYLRPFKAGVYEMAKAAGVPVVPAGIHGTNAVKPANSWLLKPRSLVVLQFGAPMDASEYDSAAEFLAELMQRVAVLSGQKIKG